MTSYETRAPSRATPTLRDIANDWELWCEYADPGAIMAHGEFDNTPAEELVQMMLDCGFSDE